MKSCWCGNANLRAFDENYLHCAECETLVFAGEPAQADPRVSSDATDFYGREYWHSFQKDQRGHDAIQHRMRSDLPERCIYWLNALLRFKLPPAKVLELGSAHGAFVALLQQSGFDATGLELSPEIVKLARDAFDIPMLLGPVEDQTIAPGSLDVIALMDVLEHFPDPLTTMQTCLKLLKPDGMLLIQTPRYPEGTTAETLRSCQDRFVAQLKPREHLYLFSQTSIQRMFVEVGAAHVKFMPAIFEFYDMFVAAGPSPLNEINRHQRDETFMTSVQKRMILTMLDAEDRFRELLGKHREVLREARTAVA